MSIVHLHLVLNHVPVIGMLFVILLLAVAAWRQDSGSGKLALWILAGLAVVTVVVFFTGEPAEEAVENVAGVSERMIHAHEEAAELALIATGFAGVMALAVLAGYWRRTLPRVAIGGMLALTLMIGGVLGWTANLGGQIRHTELSGAGTAASTRGDSDDDDR